MFSFLLCLKFVLARSTTAYSPDTLCCPASIFKSSPRPSLQVTQIGRAALSHAYQSWSSGIANSDTAKQGTSQLCTPIFRDVGICVQEWLGPVSDLDLAACSGACLRRCSLVRREMSPDIDVACPAVSDVDSDQCLSCPFPLVPCWGTVVPMTCDCYLLTSVGRLLWPCKV